MFAIVIEFVLSFLILSSQFNSLFDNNMLTTNVMNKQIESNYNNVYYSYLYNLYQDSYDDSYFEKALGIDGDSCDYDNNGNGTNDDNIDGCTIYFSNTNNVYKYKGNLLSYNDIIKKLGMNTLIPYSFITIKKYDDYYVFSTFTKKYGQAYYLGDFKIEKSK